MSKYAKQKGEPHSCGRFKQMSYQLPPSDEEKQTFQCGANSRQNFSKEQKSQPQKLLRPVTVPLI